jgi:hypothetical protein
LGTFQATYPELTPRYAEENAGEGGQWPTAEGMQAIKNWCEAAYEEAEGDQKNSDELKQVDKHIDYLSGLQWPTARPSYRAKPINNRMQRLFWELVGLLTDIRPLIDVRATERSEEMIKQEGILNDTTRAWWLNNNIDQKTAMCIVYALLTTSFAKLEWDPSINMGEGELSLIPLGPSSLLPLKPSTDLQSAEALIYVDTKACGWVKRKYPKRAHLVVPDMGLSQYTVETGHSGNVTPQLFSVLSPAYKRIMSKGNYKAGQSAYPMCKYREFWLKDYSVNTSNKIIKMGDTTSQWKVAYQVKPMEMLYPRGRLIVMAGKEIVEDCPNPYIHGLYPFSMLRLNVVPWSFYGQSLLKSWEDLQDIVNQIFAGVIDMIKRAVNPPFLAPKSALSEEAWNRTDFSMPGMKLAYNALSPQEPKVVSTAMLPGFVLPFAQSVEREMDQQSGVAAVNEAVRKKQVPGGDTLDQIRQNQQTPIRQQARNIEIFLRDLGMQMVPNIFQFYNKKKRIYIMGDQGATNSDFDWDPDTMLPAGTEPIEHVRKFKFSILEGSLLSFQRQDMVLNLMKLRQAKEIDRRTFFEKLKKIGAIDLDIDKVEANLKKEAAEGIAGAPPKKPHGQKVN